MQKNSNMKKYKNYITAVLFGSILLGTQSCELDEYNPGGSTADAVFTEEAGFNALVNSAYAYWGGQIYGREDFVLLINGGSDTWINIANSGYGRQMSKYLEGNSTTGQFFNTWKRLYEIINDCNAGLERIENVNWRDMEMRKSRLGELSFMRAYAYWHLVEMFGNVEKRTAETKEPTFTAYRSTYEELYDLMMSDLKTAIENLPVNPYPTADVGRATLKAAYGLMARVALTRVSYCKDQSEKDKYYKEAQEAADYVINNQSKLNVSLYETPAEVFDPNNNKTNKEAMFIATHSTNTNLNMQPKNPNRLHMYFHAKYSDWVGIPMNYEYGNDRNSKNGGMCMMPTRYLLNLYNEEIDGRYNAWFRENYYQTSENYTWTAAHLEHFGKPSSMVGQPIQKGELAMCFTKKVIDPATKRSLPYAVVDINDTYDPQTGGVSTDARFNIHFPTLLKFEDKSLKDRELPTNSQVGANDVIMMRLPEMYLIAAECELLKSGGQASKAADYINVIRKRAAVPGQEKAMEVAAGDMTLDFIMDERARELCGEFLRWFDLKRTGNLVRYIKDLKHNPDIAPYVNENCNLRPIPNGFLTTILNADEFGQNPGWN